MKELSLHLLDLIENSVAAGACHIDIILEEDPNADRLRLTIRDDGRGMPMELASSATDAFTTTRSARKVGMGLALLAAAAEQARGCFSLSSTPGRGTKVTVEFQLSHIDRAPLGRLDETLATAAVLHPDLDLLFRHRVGNRYYRVKTRETASSTGPASATSRIKARVEAGRTRIGSRA